MTVARSYGRTLPSRVDVDGVQRRASRPSGATSSGATPSGSSIEDDVLERRELGAHLEETARGLDVLEPTLASAVTGEVLHLLGADEL